MACKLTYAREIGETWLNALIEGRSILWWGGAGTSTEHTAWLNLKRGIAAPASGSIAVNGQAVAEQIGAQIFIDGWAIVAPAIPRSPRGSRARRRASVTTASLSTPRNSGRRWRRRPSSATTSTQLSTPGLAQIPDESPLRALVAGRARLARGRSGLARRRAPNRARKYGYDKYPGHCHVVPNHALMLMALLYAPDDFDARANDRLHLRLGHRLQRRQCRLSDGDQAGSRRAQRRVDWRGPVADRMLVSSAHGAEAIDDAMRTAYRIAGYARALAGGRRCRRRSPARASISRCPARCRASCRREAAGAGDCQRAVRGWPRVAP